MANFSAWGAERSGVRVAEQDNLKEAQTVANVAMMPTIARQKQAQAQYLGAQADLKQQQAEAQRRFAAMAMDRQSQGMWGMADAAIRSGMPDAYKWLNAASLNDYRRIAGETQQLRGVETSIKARTAALDLTARSLTGVRSVGELQAALSDIERQTGQRTGYLDAQGNLDPRITDNDVPVIVGRERAKAISTKDSLLLDLNRRRTDAYERLTNSRERNSELWRNLDFQRDKETAKAQGRLAAHGDTGLFPTNAQIGIGADFIANKFGADSKEPWARVLGGQLIDKAKRLRAMNPALSASEAIDQAFNKMDREGTFSGHRLIDKKTDLMRPAPLPSSGKIEDLKAGQLYIDDSGQTREWTGKGWSTPTRKIEDQRRAPFSLSDEDARLALSTAGGEDDESDDAEADALATQDEDE